MADWLSDLLCPLPYPERIIKGHELLNGAQDDLVRTRVAYFIAHAHRQLHQPREALEMCDTALDWAMPDDRRLVLMECRAMALYDLGRFGDLTAALTVLDGLHLPDAVRGHVLALKGCLASRSCDPAGFAYFREAEDLFSAMGYDFSQAWVQRSAASLALKTGDVDQCLAWAGRVTYTVFLPLAQLLRAEALAVAERWIESSELVAQVAAEQFGPPESEDRVRISYLQARHKVAAGRYADADVLLAQARDGFADLQRQDIDLCDAINTLRNRLRRGEVSSK